MNKSGKRTDSDVLKTISSNIPITICIDYSITQSSGYIFNLFIKVFLEPHNSKFMMHVASKLYSFL